MTTIHDIARLERELRDWERDNLPNAYINEQGRLVCDGAHAACDVTDERWGRDARRGTNDDS